MSRDAAAAERFLGAGTSVRGGGQRSRRRGAAPSRASRHPRKSRAPRDRQRRPPARPMAAPPHASCRSATAAILATRLHAGPSEARSGARRSLSSAASLHSHAPNTRGRPQARRETQTRSERSATLTHGARRLHAAAAAAAAARRKGKAARAAASRHPPAAAPPAALPLSHWPAARRGWARRLSISARDSRPWLPGGGIRVAVGGGCAASPRGGAQSGGRRAPLGSVSVPLGVRPRLSFASVPPGPAYVAGGVAARGPFSRYSQNGVTAITALARQTPQAASAR